MIIANRKTVGELSAGWTHKITLTHEDLTETNANTAQTITLLTLPAHAAVLAAGFHLETPFADASDAALNTTTLIVGDSGDTDRLIPSKELNLNGTEILSFVTANATDSIPYAFVAETTVSAIFGSMAAKSLSDLDAGQIHIFLQVSELASIN
jgi:hypothetical protein